MPKLSVLMPVYSEAGTLRAIVARVLAAPVDLTWSSSVSMTARLAAYLRVLDELADTDDRIIVVDQPRNFSFNSPYGVCPECSGIGTRFQVDPELVVARG